MSVRFKKITPQSLEFVTISSPNQIKSSETVRAIRRQAARSGAKKAKKQRYRTINIFEAEADGAQDHQEEVLIDATPKPELQNIFNSLGAGLDINLFRSSPITPNADTIHLLDFMFDDATKNYHPMHQIWMSVAMTDPSAFHMLLANAAMALSERQGRHDIEWMRYYTLSLSSMNKRMNDPQLRLSEGIVGAIVSFACLDGRMGRMDSFAIHISGLKRVIELKGGFESLKTAYALRFSIFWIDLNGSLLADRVPTFPPPGDLLGQRDRSEYLSTLLKPTLDTLNLRYEDMSNVSDAIMSLAEMALFFAANGTLHHYSEDDLTYFRHFLPVAYEVLSLRRVSHSVIQNEAMHETLRLACLVFLGLVKRHFRVTPDVVPNYHERLFSLLVTATLDWTSLFSLHLWVLAICGVAAYGEERPPIVAEISRTIGNMTWQDAAAAVKSIAWIEQATPYELDILGQEVRKHQAEESRTLPPNVEWL